MDTGTWLNIGKRSMKYIVAWTMFLDQARPIPISFLIPPEYHSQAGSTRLGEIQIDRGGCLIYPLLFRLHWVLFHSPVIGKHVRGRHTRHWSQLVHACKVEKSQTKYKKGVQRRRTKKNDFNDWMQDGIICLFRSSTREDAWVCCKAIEKIHHN